MAYTSDVEVAAVALNAGNDLLDSNLTGPTYGVREGYVMIRPANDGDASPPFQPSRYFLGYRAGDEIRTPLIVEPFGSAEQYSLPRVFGPLESEFEVNTSRLFSPENRTLAEARWGKEKDFVVGAEIPYAEVLSAKVVQRDRDMATLQVQIDASDRVYSKVLGFDVTVVSKQNGAIFLRADVSPGQTFQTIGCRLPIEIPPGRYRVAEVSETDFTIRSAPPNLEHLLDSTIVFEFRILHVDKWPEARALGALVADVDRWFGTWGGAV